MSYQHWISYQQHLVIQQFFWRFGHHITLLRYYILHITEDNCVIILILDIKSHNEKIWETSDLRGSSSSSCWIIFVPPWLCRVESGQGLIETLATMLGRISHTCQIWGWPRWPPEMPEMLNIWSVIETNGPTHESSLLVSTYIVRISSLKFSWHPSVVIIGTEQHNILIVFYWSPVQCAV